MRKQNMSVTTITNSIKNSIEAQDNEVAMVNCFASWDGQLNLEVIKQGIMERLQQFEEFEDIKLGIRFVREDRLWTRMEVIDYDKENILFTAKISLSQTGDIFSAKMEKYFSYEERKVIVDYLASNKH